MATDKDPLEEAARQLLREKVGYPASTSMRKLDRMIGRHLGYTSRLLGGESRLRLDHVSEVLAALGLDPAEFLRELANRLLPTSEAEKTERAVENFFRAFDPEGYIRKLVRDEVKKTRKDDEEEEP